MSFLLLFICLYLPNIALGQNTLSGTVRSAKNGKTLPGANVFLNSSVVGTQTDKHGDFTLRNIPDGVHTVVISFIGFKTFARQLTFPIKQNSLIHTDEFNVSLDPKTLKLKNTIVHGDISEWKKKLKKFKTYFLGHTSNADQTHILNPEVLEFKEEDEKFLAYADRPLQIKNKAMGYDIIFYLQKFTVKNGHVIKADGHSKFNLLTPKNEDQKKRWHKQRLRAYNGSYRDFIHTLVSGSLHDKGFKIYFSNYRKGYYDPKINPSSRKNVKWPNRLYTRMNLQSIKFSFHKNYKYLRVDYLKEHPERKIALRTNLYNRNNYLHVNQTSWIRLPRGKAIIDPETGNEVAPYRAVLYGYWGISSSIPELLPNGFSPYENESS